MVLVICKIVCVMILLSPQVTVMEVKYSILHELSLISYQHSGDKCNIIDVLVKKPLMACSHNGFIRLSHIPADDDHFEHHL
jgi:hypothetical protein